MIGRLAHRGPDGSGYYRDHSAILGHARLAIIDTSGGAQPLSNEDGTIWISFNGEIYNYVELSRELQSRGHVMATASDTEVIVHAWEEWGNQCFQRFNGQWALALWDAKQERLILSRDRMGIRPLFYTFSGGRFLFASEIKALLADPTVRREFDLAGLHEAFTFWSCVAPRTVYAGIAQLEPGYVAVVEDGRIQKASYWQIAFPDQASPTSATLAENREELRDKLVDAARLRFLRSDVPVGAYLSGGIDSSVTASIISRYTPSPLRTFSLRFADTEFDEGPYQDEMVRRLGTRHTSVDVTTDDIAKAFPETVWHIETPILRTAPAPLMLLSRLVRDEGYKVVVTGEGADEVLAGYDIFREMKVRLFLSRDPTSPKRRQAIRLLYPWMDRSPASVPAMSLLFFQRDLDPEDPAVSHRPRWSSTSAILSMMTPEARGLMRDSDVEADLISRMPSSSEHWNALSRAQWLEMTTLLPGYILSSQGDRMLMASSVEGRFPFLDPEVVSFANALPEWHKLLGLDEKHILKREFAEMVPRSILRRSKQPYRAPDASSFFCNSGQEWLEEMVSDDALAEAGLFSLPAVRSLFAKCTRLQGRGMSNTDNMRVVGVVSTMLVYQLFIRENGRGTSDESPPLPMKVIDMTRDTGKMEVRYE